MQTTARQSYSMNDECIMYITQTCTPVSGAYVVQRMKIACDQNDEDDSDQHSTEGDWQMVTWKTRRRIP